MRLWADVPAGERIDEVFVRSRYGANQQWWVHKHLQFLKTPKCVVAVKWGTRASERRGAGEVWAPCHIGPADGETRCWRHGGRRKREKRPAAVVTFFRRFYAVWFSQRGSR